MDSVITVITEDTEGGTFVKSIIGEYSPLDYLVVSKALKLLSENKDVHENDRLTAMYLLDSLVDAVENEVMYRQRKIK